MKTFRRREVNKRVDPCLQFYSLSHDRATILKLDSGALSKNFTSSASFIKCNCGMKSQPQRFHVLSQESNLLARRLSVCTVKIGLVGYGIRCPAHELPSIGPTQARIYFESLQILLNLTNKALAAASSAPECAFTCTASKNRTLAFAQIGQGCNMKLVSCHWNSK
jgi:hypothetical protein